MKKVAVIGGGLAGLINAILLARKGFEVTLFEEKKYPFHRVCGEYISNEVLPFLKRNDLYPTNWSPPAISEFQLTSPSGTSVKMPLDLGGFGISRYIFDHWLYEKAMAEGVHVECNRVISCAFNNDSFLVQTRNGKEIEVDIAIGAFGKRSNLDKNLNRKFTQKRYPYVGVKYHLLTSEAAEDEIALHNFKDGYCGISRIEDQKFNLCYLTHRNNLKEYGKVSDMEQEVLYKNPFLRRIYENSDFLFDKPKIINEISFYPKEPVHEHILMAGDSAGMIAPLCGNGMAMAIHSAKLLSGLIIENVTNGFDRQKLEQDYTIAWRALFQRRLWIGRTIQQLFGATYLTEFAVKINKVFPVLTRSLMVKTHGKVF